MEAAAATGRVHCLRTPSVGPPPRAARIAVLETEHGGLRAAARVIGCDPAYLLRLRDGEKSNPSDAMLKKLGLKKMVTYVRAE